MRKLFVLILFTLILFMFGCTFFMDEISQKIYKCKTTPIYYEGTQVIGGEAACVKQVAVEVYAFDKTRAKEICLNDYPEAMGVSDLSDSGAFSPKYAAQSICLSDLKKTNNLFPLINKS